MEINKPSETDSSEELDDLFEEDGTEEEGRDDVEDKGDLQKLSLEELNNISGRKFEKKEDFFKHYENLKSFVGNQELAKKREEAKEVKEENTAQELAELKKDLAKKDFLIETPTAKPFIEAVEAFAEKQGVSLDEAWNSETFRAVAEASQIASKQIISKNRIAPAQNKEIERLQREVIENGSETSKINLVKEYFK